MTRGQQGNGLSCIPAMGFVRDGRRGVVTIESMGVRHLVEFIADPVTREPSVAHRTERSTVKTGTRIAVRWPRSELGDAGPRLLPLIR